MPSYLQSSTLITSVQRRANIPLSQVTFTTDDFLAFANEEMQIGIVPMVLQFHEEFFVYTSNVPLVGGKLEYPIPSRAIGSKIRNIFLENNDGSLRDMTRIMPEEVIQYQGSGSSYVYLIKNNSIVLIGSSAGGSLALDYFMRPNQLVQESRVGIINSISPNGSTKTDLILASSPSVFSTVPMDILETSGGHKAKATDITPVGYNSITKTVTFNNSDLPSDLVVGDYVALAGECIIPQIPDDLHSMLAQRVACRCLESLGDGAGLAAANAKLKEMDVLMGMVIDNRAESDPKKVLNLHGLLRSNRRYF